MEASDKKKVKIIYTNYKGETALREVIPIKLWFGSTEWHSDEGWLMDAYDIEKKATRSFAMKEIKTWQTN